MPGYSTRLPSGAVPVGFNFTLHFADGSCRICAESYDYLPGTSPDRPMWEGVNSPSEDACVPIQLNEVSRQAATSLLENEDLTRSVALILSGVGRVLGVSRAMLCRYRNQGRTVLHTHEWSPEGGEIHRPEPRPQPSSRYAWAHDVLQRGESLCVPDTDRSKHTVAAMGAGLLEAGERSMLLLPVFIFDRLDNLFVFVDREPRKWSPEVVSILQLTIGAFARGIERRSAERECAQLAHDLEKSVQREKLANRYKSEFLANMSHELRTPMHAIVGYAELLARPNVDRRSQETWVANLKRSTEYLLTLINDVLDLSKIEAGHMSLESTPCSLVEVVAAVRDMLRGVAAEKMLSLEVEVQGELPAEVETDPVRLEQILVNLVGNAVKYTERGDVRLVLRTTEDGQWLIFDVVDTGPGIAPEDGQRLFRPFGQLNPGATEGTGLGLLISRHLARLLGGEISMTSELGEGCTFTLEIPLVSNSAGTFTCIAPSSVGPTPCPPAGAIDGAHVLVAEDSSENREVMGFLLEEAGATYQAAGNGAVAVDLALSAQLSGKPFDIVLMDMSMPVLDGYEATRRLIERGFKAPIIALTAFAMRGDRERCLEAGCIDYLTKPVVPSQLLVCLEVNLNSATDRAQEPPDSGKVDPPFPLAGNPRFQRLIERYVGSFPDQIEGLHSALASRDLARLKIRVHHLRGTAANYGFPGVSEAAATCEDALRAGRPLGEVSAALDGLVDCLNRAVAG